MSRPLCPRWPRIVGDSSRVFFFSSFLLRPVHQVDANIIVWEQKGADDNDNQLWSYDDGFLTNKKSGMVLDIRGGDLKADKEIVQYDRKLTQTLNQRFGYRDGYIYMRADPRLVLDIKGDDTEKGAKVILYQRKSEDNDNQQWEIEPFEA
ncbi:ricin B lectin domain-containing protein [Syncephalastrum racemosum]|uniref:Ricin B lectin domain-containing protein n=1 Tax=Syncephalastrum racemosum TaxID=13706 RepID=A0A1X2H458_SYNRA|nr:ricin B lectin domain-containing protein [Syncephalastrum racemosum]